MTDAHADTARILVIDDELAVCRLLERILTKSGYSVTSVGDGVQAAARIDAETFDLVLTDILMPGLDGIELLRRIREHDAELPVILFTGAASLPTAISAVNLAATAYLVKPIVPVTLIAEVERALNLRRLAKLRREASTVVPSMLPSLPDLSAEQTAAFDRALAGLFMVYQPIVSWSRKTTLAFEALVRSSESMLAYPGALFEAAARLRRLHDLSRAIRASCGETFRELADKSDLFLNVHPDDLLDDALYDRTTSASQMAQHVVLELTERARLDQVPDLRGRVATLRDIGFRLAIDDLGSGYSGLNSFALLRPDFVKIDIAMVRDINADPVKYRLVGALVDLCDDLGIGIIAEGVETHAECETLVRLGCDLLQGYLFARPGAALPQPAFGA